MKSARSQSETPRKKSVQVPEGAEFVKLLNLIEEEIRPATCRIKGFNFWPVLRFQINSKRKNGGIPGERDLPELKLPKIPAQKKSWSSWLAWAMRANDEMAWLNEALESFPQEAFDAIPSSDVLFLNRKTQYRRIGGTVLQPITDGLRWLVDKDCSHLTLTRKDPRVNDEKFLVSTGILPEIKRTRPFALLKPNTEQDFDARLHVLAKIREVNSALAKVVPDWQLNDFAVLDRLERTAFEMVYYSALFKRVRPRTIFLSSYTGANFVCAAARRLGVTVVDLQHGGMYPSHPLAANWSCIPKAGYELLPDVFWCWSEDSARWVSTTISSYHRAIAGGNPKSVAEDALQDPTIAPDLPPKSNNKKPRVLVALQYGKNQIVPAHVKLAYEATKDRVAWYFRLHPAGRDRLSEVVQILNVSASEILKFSDCTMRQAMVPMDVLLTDASTVVYESLDLGLRTAVWSSTGADYFSHLVEDRKLEVLISTEEVISFVSAPPLPSRSNQTVIAGASARDMIIDTFNGLTT